MNEAIIRSHPCHFTCIRLGVIFVNPLSKLNLWTLQTHIYLNGSFSVNRYVAFVSVEAHYTWMQKMILFYLDKETRTSPLLITIAYLIYNTVLFFFHDKYQIGILTKNLRAKNYSSGGRLADCHFSSFFVDSCRDLEGFDPPSCINLVLLRS
jgi:hypothetical protein